MFVCICCLFVYYIRDFVWCASPIQLRPSVRPIITTYHSNAGPIERYHVRGPIGWSDCLRCNQYHINQLTDKHKAQRAELHQSNRRIAQIEAIHAEHSQKHREQQRGVEMVAVAVKMIEVFCSSVKYIHNLDKPKSLVPIRTSTHTAHLPRSWHFVCPCRRSHRPPGTRLLHDRSAYSRTVVAFAHRCDSVSDPDTRTDPCEVHERSPSARSERLPNFPNRLMWLLWSLRRQAEWLQRCRVQQW